jgi:hypothetical protein
MVSLSLCPFSCPTGRINAQRTASRPTTSFGFRQNHPLREEPFIIIVVPNPKPCDGISNQNAYRAIPSRDSDRPNVFVLIDTLETKRGMKRVLCPEPICFPSTLFEVFIK